MRLLYDYFRSSSAYRVRIALNLKNLTYEKIPVHLLKDGGEQFTLKYKTLNPQALVPTYVEDSIHDKAFTQSLSIIELIEELHPEPALLPKCYAARAWVRSFAQAVACDIQPLNNLRVLKYLTEQFKINEEQKNTWYKHWIAEGFLALETMLNNHHADRGDFCHGNTPTIADVCLIPQVYNAIRYKCDLNAYPNIMKIYTHCESLPAFMEAFPKES
ncbi:MAG: maleylacetoacetate isomerase [Bdellovibrionota bacterium]